MRRTHTRQATVGGSAPSISAIAGQQLTVPALVRARAAESPDAVAVEHGGQAISYSTLMRAADSWTSRLATAGVRAGDRVAVRMGRSPELVAVLLGIMGRGAAYVPLDPAYPEQRLQLMLDDADVVAVVGDRDFDDPRRRVLHVGEPLRPRVPVVGRCAISEDVAYVLYTSGSTGRPKGVELTHAGATDMLLWAAQVFGDDLGRVLASTSICFDCSILEIFGPLTVGGTTVLGDGPLAIGSASSATGVRLLHSVPSVIDELLRHDSLPPTVRTAIVGGEAVWAGLVRTVYERSAIAKLVNLYGPTEYTSYATMAVLDPELEGEPPIGRPVANTRIELLDPSGAPVPSGAAGEIFISGAGLARGYLHSPGQTAERFVPAAGAVGQRAYRTGDLGQWSAGQLRFGGRVDDQVKVRGVRIEPVEVERALLAHPSIREAVVLSSTAQSCSADDGPPEIRLTAHLVAGTDISTDPASLRRFLGERLPSAMLPAAYVFAQRLPRLPNGKIDRSLLRPVVTPVRAPTVRAPYSDTEGLLVRLWGETLAVEAVDPDADLFDLGGHSLTALAVRERLQRRLGTTLPAALFFEHATIATLATAIDRVMAATTIGRASESGRQVAEVAALSATQRALVHREGPSLMLVTRVTGRLQVPAMLDALRTLQRRHTLLRSVLVQTPSGSGWRAGPDRAPLVVDVTSAGLSVERLTERAIASVVDRPWTLDREPPARWVVVRRGPTDHLLVVALHPAAADTWSVESLGHQALELYAASIHSRPAGPGRFVQYSELAAERYERVAADELARQRGFWTDELGDAPALEPPGHAVRSERPGPALIEEFTLPAASVATIHDLARKARATPQIVAVALHAVALHAWTGQNEFVVGCPTSGRPLPEHSTVVGPAGDAVPVRCRVRSGQTLGEVLEQVRDRALAGYGADAVPFVELAASGPRDPARHPVYQTSVVLLARPSLLDPGYSAEIAGRQPIGAVELEPLGERPTVTALDLELGLYPHGSGIECTSLSRSDAVSRSDLRRYGHQFRGLVAAAAHHPERTVGEWAAVLRHDSEWLPPPVRD
ncbi:amino acid adenylation domain-containing protein [Modestobacter sp. I12A-02628]|uniref:Amino acid adenylation domain-containing protein n=1 Tax=Goekera deserti TaxID=2497753 RepID=A0A7K3WD54_9ACTN|nr:non-ribosomal peptide synthetase [Goekera deserti]MPQ96931.1 amino acid adenylation domain-containing protein [Goekera deserti]NDI46755.1 amino acid adenylation domain-containing protein [Goekera deserti]NEL54324.1 amino acid adenylation domain-containing protein [Goekera deserti]